MLKILVIKSLSQIVKYKNTLFRKTEDLESQGLKVNMYLEEEEVASEEEEETSEAEEVASEVEEVDPEEALEVAIEVVIEMIMIDLENQEKADTTLTNRDTEKTEKSANIEVEEAEAVEEVEAGDIMLHMQMMSIDNLDTTIMIDQELLDLMMIIDQGTLITEIEEGEKITIPLDQEDRHLDQDLQEEEIEEEEDKLND